MITENIPQLAIENNDDGTITLEQEWSGNVDRVTLHALHLRFIAERMGLVPEVSASEAQLVRTVTTLKRRLLVLQKRINHLGEYLALHSDSEHADLSYETDYATATADIADEFCADLVEPVTRDSAVTHEITQTKPSGNPAGSAQLELGA